MILHHLATSNAGPGEPVRRVFVTGATGFVGRNVVRDYVDAGADVIALVRKPAQSEMIRNLGATPFIGDILDPGVDAGMVGCDALVHAAGDTDHGRGSEGQRRVNEDGTRIVFSAAKKAGVRKAVHISSEAVLADGQPMVNVDETRPYPDRPAGSYSRTKQAAERIALSFDGAEIRVCVLRPRMIWGRDDSAVLPTLVAMAHAGKLAWVDGGRYLTSATHIANLCQAIDLALAKGRGGEVYFIADETPYEFRSFVGEMLRTQGIEPPAKTVPRTLVHLLARLDGVAAAISGGRLSGPMTMQAYAATAFEITFDTSKAKRELGYMPVISRQTGMDELRVAGPCRAGDMSPSRSM